MKHNNVQNKYMIIFLNKKNFKALRRKNQFIIKNKIIKKK